MALAYLASGAAASGASLGWLLVASLLHAPGLRMFFGYRLEAKLFRANLVAIAVTILLMSVTAGIWRNAVSVFGVWLFGHLTWGCYLATHLQRRTVNK